MLYPILTLVCILLRGELSLQRKDAFVKLNSNNKSSNTTNTSISSCSVEELSKLLTDRIAMNKAIELATRRQNKTKEEFVKNMLNMAVNEPLEAHSDTTQESESLEGNELNRIVENPNSDLISHNFHTILTNNFDTAPQMAPISSMVGPRRPFKETNKWPLDSHLPPFPLFLPHRNLKPPAGANIKLEFKDKKREVTVTVSPLMTVLEALKQAEIKFQRIFKLALDEELISFWYSPTLGCITVDKISTIQNDESMMWRITIHNSSGEMEFEGFCLPANGEVFVRPGSVIHLVYTSVQNVKNY